MAKRTAVIGERPPSYVSKDALAAELCVCETTIDAYVQRGLLPKPFKLGGSVRWCWADVTLSLKAQALRDDDQFIAGIDNV